MNMNRSGSSLKRSASEDQPSASKRPRQDSESPAAAVEGKTPPNEQDREECTVDKPFGSRKATMNFPEKIMSVSLIPEFAPAIWWNTDGTEFCISPAEFTQSVLRPHFQGTKFESFTRKLNRWGFKRILGHPSAYGEGLFAYRHPFFQRDRFELLGKMEIDAEKKKRKAAAAAAAAASTNVASSSQLTRRDLVSPLFQQQTRELDHHAATAANESKESEGLLSSRLTATEARNLLLRAQMTNLASTAPQQDGTRPALPSGSTLDILNQQNQSPGQFYQPTTLSSLSDLGGTTVNSTAASSEMLTLQRLEALQALQRQQQEAMFLATARNSGLFQQPIVNPQLNFQSQLLPQSAASFPGSLQAASSSQLSSSSVLNPHGSALNSLSSLSSNQANPQMTSGFGPTAAAAAAGLAGNSNLLSTMLQQQQSQILPSSAALNSLLLERQLQGLIQEEQSVTSRVANHGGTTADPVLLQILNARRQNSATSTDHSAHENKTDDEGNQSGAAFPWHHPGGR